MYLHTEKSKENKNRVAASSVLPKTNTSEKCLGFEDNRPEANAQKKLQLMAGNNSTSVSMEEEDASNSQTNPTNMKTVQRYIGFEYQMLSSNVSIENEEDGVAKVGWASTLDGANLELKTTDILTDLGEVGRVVGEMAALGGQMSQAIEGDTINCGNKNINVTTPDDSAQPQVNFDLS